MSNSSPRQQKKLRTRELIVQQAFALFLELGFDDVTVDQIAVAAGVSRRTVFRYFPNKESIAFPTHDEKLTLLRDWLKEFSGDHATLDSVRLALLEMSKYFESTRDHVLEQQQIIEQSDSVNRFANQIYMDWADCIAEFIARDENFQAYAARVLAGSLIGGIQVAYQRWINGGCEVNEFQRLGSEVFQILSRFENEQSA